MTHLFYKPWFWMWLKGPLYQFSTYILSFLTWVGENLTCKVLLTSVSAETATIASPFHYRIKKIFCKINICVILNLMYLYTHYIHLYFSVSKVVSILVPPDWHISIDIDYWLFESSPVWLHAIIYLTWGKLRSNCTMSRHCMPISEQLNLKCWSSNPHTQKSPHSDIHTILIFY